jgi:hypothetical protein
MMDFKNLALSPLQQRVVRERRAAMAALRAPAPAPKKATTPPAPAHKEPAPRTPTAEERLAERLADRKHREIEFEKMLAFVRDPSKSPFAHLANYGAPEVELPQVAERFIAGQGSDAAQWQPYVADPAATARKIIDAAALARSGGHERAEPTGLAAQILEAGRKRRGLSDANTPFLHVVADQQQPVVATAEMICRAAAKARGEIA